MTGQKTIRANVVDFLKEGVIKGACIHSKLRFKDACPGFDAGLVLGAKPFAEVWPIHSATLEILKVFVCLLLILYRCCSWVPEE